ncbi:hypothetical protein Vadar_023687 [Vaccinium darrowii]|uniref:Uncharacterized protein n=1 Tax=Vaccinium darrowii TaxID=229202 RepID=A0ACB7X3T7_9ERIC|nr:hypothetical protein Vadar_023687 [Vaccinium darrowii]
MGSRTEICLLVIAIQFLVATGQTNPQDFAALEALKNVWTNIPPNWNGSDPCGSSWIGIQCTNSRVTSLTLPSMGLIGQLTGDIAQLSELETLDLSYNNGLTGPLTPSIGSLTKLTYLILLGCGFSGPIPDTIGSLQQLRFLYLNSNRFTGNIPPSIGNLSNLYWLDLANNSLSGTIPVSSGTTHGLNLLVNTKHFHFGNNQLSGPIPPSLFSSSMTLIHVLFENNLLNGSIPSTLALVQTLEVVRLDRNSFTGSVPLQFSNLTNVNVLYLSNNQLTGPFPNLSRMNYLFYVDLSNNSFDASIFPSWLSNSQSLTTIVMENTNLSGPVPAVLFSLPQLQTLTLSNNQLNGTLDVGSSYTNQLELVDLQNNLISNFPEPAGITVDFILVGNPVCKGTGGTKTYCGAKLSNPYPSYSTPPNNCIPATCSSNQVSSPNCRCEYPYTGTLHFRAPSFSDIGNSTIYTSIQSSLMSSFQSNQLPVDSVSLSNPTTDTDHYFMITLEVFPSGQDHFNQTGISGIAHVLSNQTFDLPSTYGPLFFIGDPYSYFAEGSSGTNKSSNSGVIIGAAAGGSVLLVLVLLAGFYAFRLKRRAEKADKVNNPFAAWDLNTTSGGVPLLKGARCFSYDELKNYTNNFAEANSIGSGGYGKVYRGTLPDGQLLAIKRAQQGSMQGGMEFKTEIELLSRVHHKNVVGLVGFCFDHKEQMLVYEYIANGSLRESLSEYYMTQQVTEKSDVYSFGVVLLELVTARQPIEKGKYIVREVRERMKNDKVLYGLDEILDPAILAPTPKGLEKFVDLAMSCVEEKGDQRPAMGEVVKEIENVLQIAGLNPNADSASTSATLEVDDSKGYIHPYNDDSLFVYSGAFPLSSS